METWKIRNEDNDYPDPDELYVDVMDVIRHIDNEYGETDYSELSYVSKIRKKLVKAVLTYAESHTAYFGRNDDLQYLRKMEYVVNA